MSLRRIQSATVSYTTFLRDLLVHAHNGMDKTNRHLTSNSVPPQENIASQLFLNGLSIEVVAERTGNHCYTGIVSGANNTETRGSNVRTIWTWWNVTMVQCIRCFG